MTASRGVEADMDSERACEHCRGPLPAGARADSRYCSGRCRMAASRRRAAQTPAPALVLVPVEDEHTAAIAARQLADALAYAAGRTGTALTAGIAPDPVDLDVIAVNAAALIARTRTRHPDIDWDDTTPVPTTAVLKLRPARSQPSRDASTRPAAPAGPTPVPLTPLDEVGRLPENLRTAAPITRFDQLAGVLGDDWVAMAKEATGQDGPDPDRPRPSQDKPSRDTSKAAPRRRTAAKNTAAPKPLYLTRKKALALLETAELAKDDDYAENGLWRLIAADDTVIGHLAPAYSATGRRSGFHAWPHGSTPNRRDRHPTLDAAKTAAASSWLRIVTAKPRR